MPELHRSSSAVALRPQPAHPLRHAQAPAAGPCLSSRTCAGGLRHRRPTVLHSRSRLLLLLLPWSPFHPAAITPRYAQVLHLRMQHCM
jgi:hypothetical protein